MNPNETIWNEAEKIYLQELVDFKGGIAAQWGFLERSQSLFYEHQREIFTEILRMVSVISFRYKLSPDPVPNARCNQIYLELREDLQWQGNFGLPDMKKKLHKLYLDDDYLSKRLPQKLFKASDTAKKDLVRYIFCRIEEYKFGKTESWRELIAESEATIEHLTAKKWRGKLANMTLLEKDINNRAADWLFEYKREIYQQSRFQITRELHQKYQYFDGEEELDERQRELTELICQIWRIEF